MYLFTMFLPYYKENVCMKKIFIYALLSMLVVSAKAQEVSDQDANQKSKAINQVKLSEQAMYAEVVELASDDFEAVSLAQQKTINKLQNNVIEACAQRMNITKEQAKEIFDIIDDKCQNVVVKKGDMVRVFAYIAKDAVGLSRKKAKQEDIDAIFGPEEDSVDSTMIADNTAQAMNLLMGQKDSIDNVSVQPAPATTLTTTTTTTTVVTTTAVTQPVVTPAQPVVVPAQPVVVPAQPVAASTPEPKVAPAPAVEVVVPVLCQTMIDKGNMKELMRYLSQEKRYHRLMFGNFSAMQYPEKCYIVIIDKATQHIVSVLDKGDSERMNFISKKMDRYLNYRNGNYAAVFVQEY